MCEVSHMAKTRFPTEPKELARLLVEKAGLSIGYASDLANAKREPSLKLAAQLERELKIPCLFWIGRRQTKSKAA